MTGWGGNDGDGAIGLGALKNDRGFHSKMVLLAHAQPTPEGLLCLLEMKIGWP